MTKNFFINQNVYNQKLYTELLIVMGSLSKLFSNSVNPYLNYRVMENIFCKAFEAENLSRGDISVDAMKDKLGIGLKTFLHNNGLTLQKIAEFNRESYLFRDIKEIDSDVELENLVLRVSDLRNKRLRQSEKSKNLKDLIYHIVTRDKLSMNIYEEEMHYIDIDSINSISLDKNTVIFYDRFNEYRFSLSKNTLFKRFVTEDKNRIKNIDIDILKDPFEYLLSRKNDILNENLYKTEDKDYIVLPLYSPRTMEVQEKSGLNMWNAGGRERNLDEVYIVIPSWIHEKKNDFFNYISKDNKTDPFKVSLPDGSVLQMRVSQAGGKALQSNPNHKLGKWILRDVLEVDKKVLVTKRILDERGIDSVGLIKLDKNNYKLEFLEIGSYEEFEEAYNI